MLKYVLYAVLSALLLIFSWPTNGFPLLLFFGFVPLLLAEHQITQREHNYRNLKIFGVSSLAFLLWNATVIWWLHYAKQYDANGMLQNSWIAYLIPVIANTLFMALLFQVYHWVKFKAGNFLGFIFLPVVWMSFDRFTLNSEISWPWFNLGNGFAEYYQWIQWYEYTGTFGGTLWILIGNLIVFYFLTAYINTKSKKYLTSLIIYPLLWIGIPIACSYTIYYSYEEKGGELNAIVLQPDLDPYIEKYSKESEQILDELIYLADKSVNDSTQFIVAPETAIPGSGPDFSVDRINDEFLVQKIKKWTKEHPKVVFVTGASLIKIYVDEAAATETSSRYGKSVNWYDSYNSAIQINEKDDVSIYHKSKLVVGVEHFPYRKILKPLIGDLMLNFGGTTNTLATQKEPSVFINSINSAVVAPVICYESIYGEFVTDYIKKGANVIFIMSNDSWWENTDGHKQLLLYGNMRAIENRRSIVRSANSGISAFINQRGDMINSLPYGEHGFLEGKVKMNEEITFYTQYGDYLARIGLLVTGIILAYTSMKVIMTRKRIKEQS